MGLMDVLNGMRNGPRGQVSSTPSSGGMSHLTMGLLALLAYKAYRGGGISGSSAASSGASGTAAPSRNPAADGSGDWLGGLGNLIAGGAGGSVLTGGISELLKRLQQTGQGQVGQSWVGTGPNRTIPTGELEKALGADTLDALSRQTGMPRGQMLSELANQLPDTVDTLTPDGRIPSDHEAARWA